MWCRKFVFILYVLQTVLSSVPPACYGMELESEIPNSQRRQSINANLADNLLGADDVTVLENDPLLSSSQKNSTSKQRKKAADIKDPNILLNGYLNYYLNREKAHLFPKYYQDFDTSLEVKTALIFTTQKEENLEDRKDILVESSVDNSPADSSSVDSSPFNWDKGFVLLKEIDRRFVERAALKSLPLDWSWSILKGVGILGGSSLALLYAASPFGIDPTRLYLINTALPLEIQSSAAIGLSAGFAIYHIFPHGMEGLNTSARLYKRFF